MANAKDMDRSGLHIRTMPKMASRLRFVSRLTGYTAISVGILVVAGWLLDVEPLKTVFPGLYQVRMYN